MKNIIILIFFALITQPLFAKVPEPEKVIQSIAAELRSAKTVGEWINKSSAKNKLFRRTHFSKYENEKIPQVINSGSTLLFFENNKKKKPSVLRAEMKSGQLHFTWNGFDITKPKNMHFEKWFQQKFSKYKQTAQIDTLSLFIHSAHAQTTLPSKIDQISQNIYIDTNRTSYWTAMMASMTADEWENVNIQEKFGAEDYSNITSAGRYMKDQYRLACAKDGLAQFDFPYSDFSDQPLRIGASYDAKKKLARIAIVRDRQDSILNMKMGEIGRLAYHVGEKDGSYTGMNIRKVNLFNGHTKAFTEHDSFREGNLINDLYSIVNSSDGLQLAPPTGDAMNYMYETTQGMVALADFARACCANADCRGQAQLPNANGVVQ